jgi:hypothetical protein
MGKERRVSEEARSSPLWGEGSPEVSRKAIPKGLKWLNGMRGNYECINSLESLQGTR